VGLGCEREMKIAYSILVEDPLGKHLEVKERDRRMRFKLVLVKSIVRRGGGWD
jgi:hypothetical protein